MPTISALDYGATPDNTTNDSAAINAAIRAANAQYLSNPSAGPVTVTLPAGTFIVSGTGTKSDGAIKLLTGTILQGAGMGQTILKVADGWAGDITGVVRTPYNEVTSKAGLLNLTIDGNRDQTTGKIDGFYTGVRPGSTQQDADIHVSGVEILDCSGYGFDPHEQTIRLTIENSVAHGNGLDGFVADYIIDGVYRNNIAYDNDRHGFNVTTTATHLLLENNEAYGNGSAGVVVQRGSENIPWPSDIQIVGGKYYNNAREGILTRMADDVTVDGATVFGNQRQGVRIEGSTDTIVQNSTIYNNSQAGHNTYDEIQIIQRADSTAGRTYYSTSSQILNNKIYSDGAIDARYGVREEPTNDDAGVTGTVVSGNTITGMASGTISVPSTADNPVVAADDTYSATEDAVLTVGAAQGVLANDTASDGGKAAVAGQITTAQSGTVALNKDGSFTYTPKANFFGSDSFTYTAVDVDGDRDTGTVTLNVQDVAETNPQPPTSGLPAIGLGTTQLETLTLNRFTLVSLSSAQGGQAVENRNKDLEATAKGTFTGESGTYKVKVVYYDESDGASPMGIRINGATAASWIADKQLGSTGSDTRTLTSYEVQLQLTKGATLEIYGTRKDAELVRVDALTVEPVSAPPPPADNPVVAANDTYSATEDTVLTVNAAQGVLANDTAPDGGKQAVAGQTTTAQGGNVALNKDGSFTYTPKTDFFGFDSFSYTAFDTDGDRATGTVTLNIQDAPETNPPPPTTQFPAIAVGTTQIETLALNKFTLISLSSAQGGQAVENRNKDVEATAKGTFTGQTGTYKVQVAYYDESDGASPMGIRVNGATAASWIADKQLGSTGSDAKTLTFYEAQLNLTQGSTFELYGTRKDAELVRIDHVSISDWQMIA